MITKILNDPITDQEIEKAIEELKVGKTPGPDGLSKFYKVIKQEMTSIL